MQGFRDQGKKPSLLNNVIGRNWRVYRQENNKGSREVTRSDMFLKDWITLVIREINFFSSQA